MELFWILNQEACKCIDWIQLEVMKKQKEPTKCDDVKWERI